MEMNSYQIKNKLTKEDVLNFANINGYDLEEKITDEENALYQAYLDLGISENDFYKNRMLDYAAKIAELILKDYGTILDNNTISKFEKFITTKESVVFLDKDAFSKISIDGKNPSAFARHEDGIVCFPTYDRSDDKDNNIIRFIRKQEQSLIHEMFHIVTRNYSNRQDFIYNGKKIGEYTPGKIFNEAIAEKSARDFATRQGLIYHPMVSYMPYVINLERFMKKYDIHQNEQMFNVNFSEVISMATEEEQKQYYNYERNYYLKRYEKAGLVHNFANANEIIDERTTQEQINKPDVKVKTILPNTKKTSDSGFTNILTLLLIFLAVIITFMINYY